MRSLELEYVEIKQEAEQILTQGNLFYPIRKNSGITQADIAKDAVFIHSKNVSRLKKDRFTLHGPYNSSDMTDGGLYYLSKDR